MQPWKWREYGRVVRGHERPGSEGDRDPFQAQFLGDNRCREQDWMNYHQVGPVARIREVPISLLHGGQDQFFQEVLGSGAEIVGAPEHFGPVCGWRNIRPHGVESQALALYIRTIEIDRRYRNVVPTGF